MRFKRYTKRYASTYRKRGSRSTYARNPKTRTKRYSTVRTTRKRNSYGKKARGPTPPYCGSPMVDLRRICRTNEDYTTIFTDSQSYNASGQSAQTQYLVATIDSLQCCMHTDFTALLSSFVEGPVTQLLNQSLILKQCTHELTFTNQDPQTCFFKVWLVRAKRDIPTTTADSQAYGPQHAWQIGVESTQYGAVPAYSTTSAYTALGYRNPASNPYDSSMFDRYYYTVKQMKFQLLPGASKIIKYSVPNLPWKFQTGIDASNNGGTKGITSGCLYQVLGSPFVSNAAGTTNGAYYSNPQFSVVEQKRYRFTNSGCPTKYLNYSSNWSASNATIPTVNQLCMNPLVGVDNIYGLPVTGNSLGANQKLANAVATFTPSS